MSRARKTSSSGLAGPPTVETLLSTLGMPGTSSASASAEPAAALSPSRQTEPIPLSGGGVSGPLVEPSADERRNGWNAASLTKYLQEQQASADLRDDPASSMRRPGRRPQRQTNLKRVEWDTGG